MINLTQTFQQVKQYASYAIIIILLLLLIGAGIELLHVKNENFKLQDKLVTEEYSKLQPFITKIAKDSSTILEQSQLLADKNSTIVKQIEKIEHLKSLNSQIVYNTITKIDTIKIPYIDSAKLITKVDSLHDTTQYLQVPIRAQLINKHYQIDETVLANGIELNEMSIPDSTTIIIGEKGNLFHTESIIRIKHSNPFLKTTEVKNIETSVVKNKPVKTFFIGTGVGVALTTVAAILVKVFVMK